MRRIQTIGVAALMASMLLVTNVALAAATGSTGTWVTRAEFVVELDQSLDIAPVYPTTPDFRDGPALSPDYGYIEAAYKKGFTNGVSAGFFGPHLPVTRAEVAKWLVLAVGASAQASKAAATSLKDA